LRQKKIDQKIFLSIIALFFLLPVLSHADAEEVHRIVNGEEVYEPKKEETKTNAQSQKKKETPKENQNEIDKKDKETKNKMEEGKPKDTKEAKTPMNDIKSHEVKSMEAKKEVISPEEKTVGPKKDMDMKTSEGMNKYKANKLVSSDEEDPYEIHKPIGIFWFFGVFMILVIVIFVFT
jgi:hypothetical protein